MRPKKFSNFFHIIKTSNILTHPLSIISTNQILYLFWHVLKVSKFMNRMIFNSSKDGYDDKARKIRMLKRLAKLYKPYVVFKAMYVISRRCYIFYFISEHTWFNFFYFSWNMNYFLFQLWWYKYRKFKKIDGKESSEHGECGVKLRPH